jgi:hypothetical protein
VVDEPDEQCCHLAIYPSHTLFLAGGWLLVLICYERSWLLVLICSKRKILLANLYWEKSIVSWWLMSQTNRVETNPSEFRNYFLAQSRLH